MLINIVKNFDTNNDLRIQYDLLIEKFQKIELDKAIELWKINIESTLR